MSKNKKSKIEIDIINEFFEDYKNKKFESGSVFNTCFRGIRSPNSFSFYRETLNESNFHSIYQFISKSKKSDIIKYDKDTIGSIFGINLNNENLYQKDFIDAICGKGNEWRTIRTLHSSALCGFLHFYKINQNNPIVIPKYFFEKQDEDLVFDEVKFEFEFNCVGENSSFDIVLINKKTDNIMFIELKFSEYLGRKIEYPSSKYLDSNKENLQLYNKVFANDQLEGTCLRINRPNDLNNDSIKMYFAKGTKRDNKFYIGGVKQLLSHSIAMNNYKTAIQKAKDKGDTSIYIPSNIYYLELMFDFNRNEGIKNKKSIKYAQNSFDKFNDAYKNIISKLCIDGIKYAKNVFSYQDLFNYKSNTLGISNIDLLNKNIKDFYKY